MEKTKLKKTITTKPKILSNKWKLLNPKKVAKEYGILDFTVLKAYQSEIIGDIILLLKIQMDKEGKINFYHIGHIIKGDYNWGDVWNIKTFQTKNEAETFFRDYKNKFKHKRFSRM